MLKNCHLVTLIPVVSKVFEKLVNNRIIDHLEKCDLFSDFQYGFRSSRSTADLLAVVSDKIARAFSTAGAIQAVTIDICMTFNRVCKVLTRKLQFGPSGPNWESEHSEHACISVPKWSWGVCWGALSPPHPHPHPPMGVLGVEAP